MCGIYPNGKRVGVARRGVTRSRATLRDVGISGDPPVVLAIPRKIAYYVASPITLWNPEKTLKKYFKQSLKGI